jgi:hypothetical protein
MRRIGRCKRYENVAARILAKTVSQMCWAGGIPSRWHDVIAEKVRLRMQDATTEGHPARGRWPAHVRWRQMSTNCCQGPVLLGAGQVS